MRYLIIHKHMTPDAIALWSWRRGTKYYRAHRVLEELCLQARELRGHRQLGVDYMNTIGRWWLEAGGETT